MLVVVSLDFACFGSSTALKAVPKDQTDTHNGAADQFHIFQCTMNPKGSELYQILCLNDES